MTMEWKGYLICGALALVWLAYDRLVPRSFPCGDCMFSFHGCMPECGPFKRYRRALGRQAETRLFFRKVGRRMRRHMVPLVWTAILVWAALVYSALLYLTLL